MHNKCITGNSRVILVSQVTQTLAPINVPDSPSLTNSGVAAPLGATVATYSTIATYAAFPPAWASCTRSAISCAVILAAGLSLSWATRPETVANTPASF